MIISNNYKAKGLRYASIYKIKKKVFDFNNTLSEKKVINELKKKRYSFNLSCRFYENFNEKFY